ncbi:spore coat protein [Candidatus Saganbacteria bacterium CG08_land_8_20_14_0_20_45_16]|uniref:Spore coat protein n=1 Tax=Candidatus Saganbacteria bacterium CG08_land_8_20_14_0_20_45_16 TaxID=2014293 RepID=A0A2H0XU60_UNCSA|nr:MAG: spore coat protein [Candidatus Saganbacteria bacterium CG08_land_8_20_14_0_20_45_16]
MFDKLFIFEMANNHSGDVQQGLRIIREISQVAKQYPFNFAFKFQYRDLKTFIHPDYQGRQDIKYVKRFSETALTEEDFLRLKKEIASQGLLSVCTPFDEASVDKIVDHKYDALKIASCSFTDWPLLEKIVQTNLPLIASTATASLAEIDQVVAFFEHRGKKLCLMHCVGEYPTQRANLQLSQIDLLQKRYPEIAIGFSTHEEPDNIDAIKIAIAKGARVFERHVALESDKYPINKYSSTPAQIEQWLKAAQDAFGMCGAADKRSDVTEKERADLRGLKRGVFAKIDLEKGAKLAKDNVFFAIPCQAGQLVANELSKYAEYILEKDLKTGQPLMMKELQHRNLRAKVLDIIKELKGMIIKSHLALPNRIDLELSHHYGIEKYEEWGAAILNCINREYCKKLIILLPGQKHPVHHHVKKEETFQVLFGDMLVKVDGQEKNLKAGDMLTVERNMPHSFVSTNGCVFEEISTTHYKNDSFYEDEKVVANKERKTEMTFWSDWLVKEVC